jgi:hypothetical protein
MPFDSVGADFGADDDLAFGVFLLLWIQYLE